MRNTLGHNITLTIFGESHGPYIGATLDGVPGGVKVDEDNIRALLAKRRPQGKGETPRIEKDEFQIISGVFNGYSNGEAITIIIPNSNTHSSDYQPELARPGHADYVANEKYHGFQDYRGGGHFSGRITAAIVAAGAIALDMLASKKIAIGAHIEQLGSIKDARFDPIFPEIEQVNAKDYPTIQDVGETMQHEAEYAASERDSIGGIVEAAISGLPIGVGETWFSSLDGELANAMLSLGAVKGIEFGAGFELANMKGSESNDPLWMEGDKAITLTNNAGGVNGGMSNGMPVIYRMVVKPTPSIGLPQKTVDMSSKENAEISVKGRHDPAIVRRIVPVVRALSAIVVVDLLSLQYGREYFAK